MDKPDLDKLTRAFEHLVEQVGEAVHDTEEALAPTIDEIVHNAQVTTREIFALSQEEVEILGNTLKRDLHKANQALNREGKELRQWFAFDLGLIEDRFIDLVKRAADKTWLEFRDFEFEDHQASVYHSGEICNAGSFSCRACSNIVQLPRTGALPACPACDQREFYRVID